MPKLNAFRSFPYTAVVYNYTRSTNPDGTTKATYFRARDIKVDVQQTMFGRLTIYFSDDSNDVMPEAQLRELSDKKGNELFANGVWTLTGLVPALTPVGTREGYRAEARLTLLDG